MTSTRQAGRTGLSSQLLGAVLGSKEGVDHVAAAALVARDGR